MRLVSIQVTNFRSIEDVTFHLQPLPDGSATFTLIGVNESGKSSLLTAFGLLDEEDIVFPRDYFRRDRPVEIRYSYDCDLSDIKLFKEELKAAGVPPALLHGASPKSCEVLATYDPVVDTKRHLSESAILDVPTLDDYTLTPNGIFKKTSPTDASLDFVSLVHTRSPQFFYGRTHFTSFWRADARHLISEPVGLKAFASEPSKTSVPLTNCFELAGIPLEAIPSSIEAARADVAERNNLQQRLGDAVTRHIRKVWPKHPITIRFQIDTEAIAFLVEDDGVKYSAKSTEQRSDGFRQFISFLLTISAENTTGQLSHTLLLLDEPETHLHPQAQEDLMRDLIRITSSKEENIVIYATHSNYMIDKSEVARCYRVAKREKVGTTTIEQICSSEMSYAAVNYEVFDIATTDYHNELYGYLEAEAKHQLDALPKAREWKNAKTGTSKQVSLPEYIRHTIHHPENTLNTKYSPGDLRKSIDVLRRLKK